MKREWTSQTIFFACASIVVISLLFTFILIGSNAYQTFTQSHVSIGEFFTSTDFDYSKHFGILTFVIGSALLVALSLLLAVPLSLGVALYITEIAPPWIANPLRAIVELFLGIPSVVFGLLGLTILVPFFANLLNNLAQAITGVPDVRGHAPLFYSGSGIIPAVIVITFMIMPTITTIGVDALRTVPVAQREGSLALGATRWQTLSKAIIPAALPGIMTGIILGATRAIGETLAVAFVVGNAANLPIKFLNVYPYIEVDHTGVLTTVLLAFGNFTAGPTYNAIWTIAFVLLVISALMIVLSRSIASRGVYQ